MLGGIFNIIKEVTMTVNQVLTITLQATVNNNSFSFVLPYGCPSQDAIAAFNELGKSLMQMATPPAPETIATAPEAEAAPKETPVEVTPELVS